MTIETSSLLHLTKQVWNYPNNVLNVTPTKQKISTQMLYVLNELNLVNSKLSCIAYCEASQIPGPWACAGPFSLKAHTLRLQYGELARVAGPAHLFSTRIPLAVTESVQDRKAEAVLLGQEVETRKNKNKCHGLITKDNIRFSRGEHT